MEELKGRQERKMKNEIKKSRLILNPLDTDRKMVINSTPFYYWLRDNQVPHRIEAIKKYTGFEVDKHFISEYDMKTLTLIFSRFWIDKFKGLDILTCQKSIAESNKED